MTPDEYLLSLPKPKPSGGLDYYRNEREACLALDPRRKANYDKYLASRLQSAVIDYRPVKMDVENVSRCNFRCTMCIVSEWKGGKRAEDMTLDQFKSFIDEEYGIVEIKLNGLGEALLQGDEYFEMIRYARSKRIWVRMTTNASVLHARDNYKRLIDSDVNEIDISIDGATKEVFESIRKRSRFERVLKNCRLLNDYAASKGVVRTKMWTLTQEGNHHQMAEILDLAAELGFKHSIFSLNLHGWGDSQLAETNRKKIVQDSLSVEHLQGLVEQGSRLGVNVSFWSVSDKFDHRQPETRCPWPFERAVITSDLKTVPCCMIGDPNAYEIGKDSGLDFHRLWHSDEYVSFRQSHIDGNMPDLCKNCYVKVN